MPLYLTMDSRMTFGSNLNQIKAQKKNNGWTDMTGKKKKDVFFYFWVNCPCEGEKQKNCYYYYHSHHTLERPPDAQGYCVVITVFLEARCNDTAVPLCHKQTQKTIRKSGQQNTVNWLCVSVTGWTVMGPHSIKCWYVTMTNKWTQKKHFVSLSSPQTTDLFEMIEKMQVRRRVELCLPSSSFPSCLLTKPLTSNSQCVSS